MLRANSAMHQADEPVLGGPHAHLANSCTADANGQTRETKLPCLPTAGQWKPAARECCQPATCERTKGASSRRSQAFGGTRTCPGHGPVRENTARHCPSMLVSAPVPCRRPRAARTRARFCRPSGTGVPATRGCSCPAEQRASWNAECYCAELPHWSSASAQ